MSLLSEDDKALLVLEHLGPAALASDTMSLYDCFQLALDVAEKAVLAKLASAELPEPHKYPADCFMREVNVCDALAVSIAIQQAHAQGFAAGAAAQLAEKPLAYFYHDASCPEMANPLLHSTLLLHADERNSNLKNETPLYTRREA